MTRRVILTIALVVMIQASTGLAKNRFPVIGYQDFTDMACDTFYAYLDTFALSHYMAFNADSAGKYNDLYDLGIDFYTHHWGNVLGQRISLIDSTDFDLNWANRSLFCGMSSINDNPVQGYRRDGILDIGRAIQDNTLNDRTVWGAFVTEDGAGLMHPAFDLGVFMYTSHGGQYSGATTWNLKYHASLRMLDTTGNNGSVVAKLIFENRCSDVCSTSASPYAVYRYNDTLLCRYENGNYICYPTIDRTASATEKLVVVSYCDAVAVKEDRRDITNVCFIDTTGDSVCTVPYRFVRDVIDTEFADPASYVTISEAVVGKSGWGELFNYKVYWTDVKDMYLDSLYFFDENGRVYDSLVTNDLDEVVDSIEAWYTTHTLANGEIAGFRPLDEPVGPEMQNQRRMRSITSGISANGTPKALLSTLGAYNSNTTAAIRGQYFDTYVEYADTTHFIFDFYQTRSYFTSSSRPDDYSNVQCMLDYYADYYALANERARAISAARSTTTDYWVLLPTFDWWSEVPESNPKTWYQWLRMPTGNEVRALVNLALSYGCRGVGYWPYVSHVNADKSAGQGYEMANPDTVTMIGSDCTGAPAPGADFCDSQICPTCAECQETQIEPVRNALVYRDNGKPYGIWWDVKDVNLYLDSMAFFFLNADWRSAGPAAAVASLTGSFIDSIKTMDTRFSNDSAFIEASFFDYSSETYAYIVNRRVDDGTYDWVDSQTVKLYMPGAGAYEMWDVYANKCDTVWDSAGTIQWTRHMEPGGAALVKLESLKSNWSGTVGAQWYWSIPAGASINVTGDIVVPYGTTLELNRSRVTVSANSDDQSSGLYTNWTEISVNGTLKVVGSATERPLLGPAQASDSSWHGITAGLYGKVVLDNAVIRNAYQGVYLSGYRTDTVKNCRFEDCFMYGIYTRSDSSYIVQDTFVTANSSSEGHGIYVKWSDPPALISNCYFEDIKYPVRIWAATAPISNCEFRTTEFSGAGGTPAITFDIHGDITITACDFYGYSRGLQLAYSSDIEVYGSSFQNVDTDDRMHVAIYGAPSTSSLYSESNCFMSAWDAHVVAHKTTCQFSDDGLADDGANSFNSALEFFKSAKDQPDTNMVPPWAIINDSSVSVVSWSDYWRTRAEKPTPIDWVKDGNATIYAPTYSDISMYCPDPSKEGVSAANNLATGTELVPEQFELHQNYPNPFNMTTVIPFSTPYSAQVRLDIFNVLGQRIATLWNSALEAGKHSLAWDGRSYDGVEVSSGVYFYRLTAGNVELSRKMVVLK